MDKWNITILGGGSAYTPGLIEALLRFREELPIGRLVLMDIDPHKLKVVGELTEHLLRSAGCDAPVRCLTDRRDALEGADFVLCQIRVGGLAARALDEKIPLKHGVIGQETTGPGGFAMALRTVPVMLDVARDMEEICPHAWLINYTNPTGIVAGALYRHTGVKAISICDVPLGTQHLIAQLMGVPRQSISVDYVGLNHLGWFRRIFYEGQDILPKLAEMAAAIRTLPPDLADDERAAEEFGAVLELFRVLKVIPSYYLQYYYFTDRILAKQKAAPRTRAEEVMAIERDLLSYYQEVLTQERPDLWKKRGGDWHADMMVGLVGAIANNKQEVYVVNVLNRGAVKGMADLAVVEIPAMIDRRGAHPLVVGEVSPWMLGLMQVVGAYELLTAEAAMEGSYEKALQALTLHPLVPSLTVAQAILDDYLEAHAEYLPLFAAARGQGHE